MPVLLAAALFTLSMLSTSPAWAAAIVTNVTVEVTSVDPGITALQVGDRFELSFTLEDSIVDTNVSVNVGNFPSLLTNWTMTASPGNSGSWMPTGSVNLPLGDYSTSAPNDRITMEIGGTGFPDGGVGLSWEGFNNVIDWASAGLTDNGAGDTFAAQLGQPFEIPPGILELQILFDSGNGFITARLAAVPSTQPASPVPIPIFSPIGFVLMGLLLGFVAVRRLI